MKRSKPVYGLITFVPFVFMLTTTAAAGVMNIFGNYLPRGDMQGYVNVALTVIMLVLACVITATSAASWIKILREPHRQSPAV